MAAHHHFYRQGDGHGTRLFKNQREGLGLTIGGAFGQAHEHQMQSPLLKGYAFPGLDFEPAINGAHFHHAAIHFHGMNFAFLRA